MAQIKSSLNGATTDGAGTVWAFDVPKTAYGIQYAVTVPVGGPVKLLLESSLDGVNYITAQSKSISADEAGYMSSNVPALFIRANVTGLGGGRTATALMVFI